MKGLLLPSAGLLGNFTNPEYISSRWNGHPHRNQSTGCSTFKESAPTEYMTITITTGFSAARTTAPTSTTYTSTSTTSEYVVSTLKTFTIVPIPQSPSYHYKPSNNVTSSSYGPSVISITTRADSSTPASTPSSALSTVNGSGNVPANVSLSTFTLSTPSVSSVTVSLTEPSPIASLANVNGSGKFRINWPILVLLALGSYLV